MARRKKRGWPKGRKRGPMPMKQRKKIAAGLKRAWRAGKFKNRRKRGSGRKRKSRKKATGSGRKYKK